MAGSEEDENVDALPEDDKREKEEDEEITDNAGTDVDDTDADDDEDTLGKTCDDAEDTDAEVMDDGGTDEEPEEARFICTSIAWPSDEVFRARVASTCIALRVASRSSFFKYAVWAISELKAVIISEFGTAAVRTISSSESR